MRLLLDIFGQTLSTLWNHKLRSFLTMFGIAWGVFSLLLLVGLGEGFRTGNRKQFDSIGENVMFIWGGRAPAVEGNFTSMRWYFLTEKDYRSILAGAPSVRDAVPVIARSDIKMVSDYFNTSGRVEGALPKYNQIRYLPIADGRWINDDDLNEKHAVIVIGDETRRLLFSGRNAVGQTILLNGIQFQVIGTLQRIGHGDNANQNMRCIVPYSTMRMYFPPLNTGEALNPISFINYQPKSRALHEEAKIEVHKIVARNHGFAWDMPDAYDEWDTINTVDQVGKIFDAMDVFLGSVGLVTLALGAIGIINIMLVAVADRTKEIGLRKAVGATNRSILFQFFVEGAFLTLMSGAIGMGCAQALMWTIQTFMKMGLPNGFDPPRLVPLTATLAIGSLALAGVVAGLYPARRAAMLEPVEALRKE
ncbi:MAG TPA: ABC transporter permease [Terriglobales bacterium]|nr:ABC transporter permease [Terriglobales bacterium]